MLFPAPLVRGTLVRRYKRFLGDVVLDTGETVVTHVANPGAMTGLSDPGMEIWLSPASNPARKLAWNWELARVDGGLVGINTAHPNTLVAEALLHGSIPDLAGYPVMRREVKYGEKSRVDFVLEGPGKPPCYLEVKNVHLKRGEAAAFPDAVTLRGSRHLAELAAMAALGARAVTLFLVQREDCAYFTLADDIDPAYARAFDVAMAAGAEVLCYSCPLTLDGIVVDRPVPIYWPRSGEGTIV